MRYFFKDNVHYPVIEVKGTPVVWTRLDGTSHGVIATEDGDSVNVLSDFSKKHPGALKEMGAEDYEKLLKKNRQYNDLQRKSLSRQTIKADPSRQPRYQSSANRSLRESTKPPAPAAGESDPSQPTDIRAGYRGRKVVQSAPTREALPPDVASAAPEVSTSDLP